MALSTCTVPEPVTGDVVERVRARNRFEARAEPT